MDKVVPALTVLLVGTACALLLLGRSADPLFPMTGLFVGLLLSRFVTKPVTEALEKVSLPWIPEDNA